MNFDRSRTGLGFVLISTVSSAVDVHRQSRRCLVERLVYCQHDTLILTRRWMQWMELDDDLWLDSLVQRGKGEE
jgi:hypothetical protein